MQAAFPLALSRAVMAGAKEEEEEERLQPINTFCSSRFLISRTSLPYSTLPTLRLHRPGPGGETLLILRRSFLPLPSIPCDSPFHSIPAGLAWLRAAYIYTHPPNVFNPHNRCGTHIYTQANDDVLLTVCVEEEEELYTTILLVGPETPCVRVVHAQLHTLEDPPGCCKFPSGIEYRIQNTLLVCRRRGVYTMLMRI